MNLTKEAFEENQALKRNLKNKSNQTDFPYMSPEYIMLNLSAENQDHFDNFWL